MASKSIWFCTCHWAALIAMVGWGGGSSQSVTPPPQAKADFLYGLTNAITPTNTIVQLSSFKVDTGTGRMSSPTTTSLTQITPGVAIDPASKFLYLSDNFAISIFSTPVAEEYLRTAFTS